MVVYIHDGELLGVCAFKGKALALWADERVLSGMKRCSCVLVCFWVVLVKISEVYLAARNGPIFSVFAWRW